MDEPLLNDRIPPLSKKKCALIIIFFTASLLIITFVKLYLIEESIPPNIPQHNDTWDYLLFTQQWPISFCNDWIEKKEKSPDACVFSQNKYAWTVHGIWPSESNSSSYPEFCRRIPFNESDLTSIEDELIEHWSTTQKTANGSVSFWRHEWLKHGTCAVQIPQLDTELKYFTQGLEWNKHFNLTEALISCSIYPSDSKPYNVSEVEQCFKQTYDLIPQLYCVPNDVFGEDILLEIRLCVGKDLSFTSCDEFGANTICKDEFIYPATVSKKSSFAT